MKYSQMLIPTLREAPSDAEAISHKLLIRAGYFRQLASGLYITLPLGHLLMQKICNIIRQEMNAIGAQELSMPVLHPAEIWQKTGRWYDIKDEMFRLKDRTGREMCLAMTHEEIMTWLASKEIKSYRDLPQSWYQFQTKLRDEARPKSGILRTREFIMKDSYSFDVDDEGLNQSYEAHAQAYNKIFKICGLDFCQVASDTGMMGGAEAHEFMAFSPAGEDEIIICKSCGYSANIEVSITIPKQAPYFSADLQEIYTPNQKTIEQVSNFLKLSPSNLLKSLTIMTSEGKPVLVLLRGDQILHEKKLTKAIGLFRFATDDEIKSIFNSEPGFIGPLNQTVSIIADPSLSSGSYVAGANKADYHISGVTAKRDFNAAFVDIHVSQPDEMCAKCGANIEIKKAIEVGNIFKLGIKYSKPLNATYLDKNGKENYIVMGSYGIGPARIAAAYVEQNHDADGIIWNKALTPFDFMIIPLNVNDAKSIDYANTIYNSLKEMNYSALFDDRDLRPGVKLKDADLIGIPVQIILGEKNLKSDLVEIKLRKTKQSHKVSIADAIAQIIKLRDSIE